MPGIVATPAKKRKITEVPKTDIVDALNGNNSLFSVFQAAQSQNNDGFFKIGLINAETKEHVITDFYKCLFCPSIYKGSGGHFKRHRSSCRATSQVQEMPIEPTNKSDVGRVVSKYLALSGKAAFEMEKSEFVEFCEEMLELGKYVDSPIDKLIPCRTTISRTMESICDEIHKEIEEKLSNSARKKQMNIMADFGKIQCDIFCIKASFIEEIVFHNDDAQEVGWVLCIVPLAANSENCDQKTSDNIHSMMMDIFKKFGWSRTELDKCALTSDGAKNLELLGKIHLLAHIHCSSHVTNLLAQRTLKPYRATLLTHDQMKELSTFVDIVDKCAKLSKKIKSYKKITSNLGINIIQPVETRWFSSYRSVKSVLESIDLLIGNKKHFNDECRNLIESLNVAESRHKMEVLIAVLEPMAAFNVKTQTEEVNIHHVVPVMAGLSNIYEEKRSLAKSEDERILCLSALESLKHQIEYSLTKFHAAALLLNPAQKNVQLFQDWLNFSHINYQIKSLAESAISEISGMLNEDKEAPVQSNDQPTTSNHNDVIDNLINFVTVDRVQARSVEEELVEYMKDTSSESLEFFWPKKKLIWPKLHNVAKKIYGIVSSQSSCERSFSTYKYVFTPNRSCIGSEVLEKLLIAREYDKFF